MAWLRLSELRLLLNINIVPIYIYIYRERDINIGLLDFAFCSILVHLYDYISKSVNKLNLESAKCGVRTAARRTLLFPRYRYRYQSSLCVILKYTKWQIIRGKYLVYLNIRFTVYHYRV
jgi:hypothetical protein